MKLQARYVWCCRLWSVTCMCMCNSHINTCWNIQFGICTWEDHSIFFSVFSCFWVEENPLSWIDVSYEGLQKSNGLYMGNKKTCNKVNKTLSTCRCEKLATSRRTQMATQKPCHNALPLSICPFNMCQANKAVTGPVLWPMEWVWDCSKNAQTSARAAHQLNIVGTSRIDRGEDDVGGRQQRGCSEALWLCVADVTWSCSKFTFQIEAQKTREVEYQFKTNAIIYHL